ncbi:hypothetical protein BD324DRAFT_624088 [Kockovaella imperatae]|uniref:Uncharacterized protein n=1 Tax=Kockovaella imperatae TaxID=4999 RepID=A0A1Y1UIV2_9TREE|nr:hypothetical protein BD324DRAFT_624088 [Kockovaella imperatae]ORX37993.1 hypothetical protein BD324DRAFT_624088 [Kockovaella imperatae]
MKGLREPPCINLQDSALLPKQTFLSYQGLSQGSVLRAMCRGHMEGADGGVFSYLFVFNPHQRKLDDTLRTTLFKFNITDKSFKSNPSEMTTRAWSEHDPKACICPPGSESVTDADIMRRFDDHYSEYESARKEGKTDMEASQTLTVSVWRSIAKDFMCKQGHCTRRRGTVATWNLCSSTWAKSAVDKYSPSQSEGSHDQ